MDVDKPKRGPGRPKGSKTKKRPPPPRRVPEPEEVKRLRRVARAADNRRNRRALILQRHIYALKVMTNELNLSLWSVANCGKPDLSCFFADFRQLLTQAPQWQMARATGMSRAKLNQFSYRTDVMFVTILRVCYGLGLRVKFEVLPEFSRLSPDPVHALVPDVDKVGLKARNPEIMHDLGSALLRKPARAYKPDPEGAILYRNREKHAENDENEALDD